MTSTSTRKYYSRKYSDRDFAHIRSDHIKMGANCAKCCICYCLKSIECPACCRCPSPIKTCTEGCCECADCCDDVDQDMEAVLQADKPRPRHGEARYTYENGDIYHGHWKNGLRHGKGELMRADGTRLVNRLLNYEIYRAHRY